MNYFKQAIINLFFSRRMATVLSDRDEERGRNPLRAYALMEKIENMITYGELGFSISRNWFSIGLSKRFCDGPDRYNDLITFGYRRWSVAYITLFRLTIAFYYVGMASWYECECTYTCEFDEYEVNGKAYPIYQNEQYTSNPSCAGYDWQETHYCPFCKKEYTFDNSSY